MSALLSLLLLLLPPTASAADLVSAPREDTGAEATTAEATTVEATTAEATRWPEGVACGLSAEGAALSRVMRIIEIKCDVRFEFAPGLADTPVDVHLRDAPCAEAAGAIAAAAGARLRAGEPGVFLVYPTP